MKGTRPLDNDEIRRVFACFDGIFEVRNRGAFHARRFPLAAASANCSAYEMAMSTRTGERSAISFSINLSSRAVR